MKETTQLDHVDLQKISVSKTNKMFRDESELSQEALQELIDSINQKGVIQPILLRPNGEKGKYELVCGERRFQSSKLAGIEKIPAYIILIPKSHECEFEIKDVCNLEEDTQYEDPCIGVDLPTDYPIIKSSEDKQVFWRCLGCGCDTSNTRWLGCCTRECMAEWLKTKKQ